MKEVLDYLKLNSMMYVATCDGDQPRVRIFSAYAVMDDKLYLVTSNTKPIYHQLMANPKTEICVMVAEDQWMRITATLVEDTRREARVEALNQNEMLKGMYSADDGVFTTFYLKDAVATISSLSGASHSVKF